MGGSRGGGGLRGGGLTNEGPGTDHVIKGPMRGLKINCMRRVHIYPFILGHCDLLKMPHMEDTESVDQCG